MLFNAFTKQYPLSKTLRFELKPLGKTLAHIHAKNFLQKDATLADSYQKIKPILDEYHRDFIELALKDIELMELENFHTHYLALKQNKTNNNAKKSLQDLQKKLCEAIANKLEKAQKDNSLFSKLHSADLFNEDILKKWVEDTKTQHLDKISDIERFKRFAGYFNGFQTSRKNFYSKEAKKGSIAYRIVYENLPRFCNNMDVLKVITQNHPELYTAIQKILSDVDLLDINCYDKCLSQSGIDKYNRMIGEINKKSNEYNQQNKLTGRNKIANLRKLYKQILSLPEVDLSFLPEALKNDKELVVALNGLYLGMDNQSIYTELKQLICEIENAYNLDKIYINPKKIGYLSKCAYDNWHLLRTLLEKDFQQNNLQGKKEEDEKYYKRQIEHVESYHSIAYLNSLVKKYNQDVEDKLSENAIIDTLMSFKKLVIDNNESSTKQESVKYIDIIKDINEKYKAIKGLLNDDYEDDSKRLCSKNKDNVDNNIYNIRLFLDAINDFWKFSKILYIKNQSSDMEIDTDFYAKFEELYKSLSIYISTYNKARNYLTQKVDNTQKFKLNFENPTLLKSWSESMESSSASILLRDGGNYYLGIVAPNCRSSISFIQANNDCEYYEKFVYQQIASASKDVQNLMKINGKVVKKNGRKDPITKINYILEDLKNQYLHDNINRIRKDKSFSVQSENFNRDDLNDFIDFYKEMVVGYFVRFNFVFKDANEYNDFSDFLADVDRQGNQMKFDKISKSCIDELVEKGDLYLFQIYSKDFSNKSYGNKNLHTLYFQALFSQENFNHRVYDIGGNAQMFYRKASLNIDEVAKHPAGEMLKMKNPNNKTVKQATHTIYKDKRYTDYDESKGKFLLHIPITMNFGASDVGFKAFNQKVNQTLKNSQDDIHIIGIDRGERHLLYVSVINQKGEIIEQKSLNEIVNTGHNGIELKVNYHTLLDNKEKERLEARVNWGEIENIKEIKQGYLSQVVHYISQLMLKHNAIVVLEDLNFGFKRGRFKVEKQVYQNFENALIKKLNYLVLKNKAPDELGGVRNALQLTNKFEDIKDIGKQTGFIFYVPAWNTSKIDPTTGFVNLLPLHYENTDKSKIFFEKFDSISYNANKDYFEFALDYKKFTDKATDSKTNWVICSHGDMRYVYHNTTKSTQKINVNDCLKALFDKHQINYQSGNDLIDDICNYNSKDLYSSLYYYLKVLVSMRYSNATTDDDFILSPVANKNGEFFDSRKADKTLPNDADANGAYHIAKKGLWVLKQIKANDNLDKLPAISNQDWLKFVQKQ